MGRAHGDRDTARVQAAVEGRDELDACKDTTAALGDTGLGTAGQCCSSPGVRETLPQPRWATSAAQHQGQHEEAEKVWDREGGKERKHTGKHLHHPGKEHPECQTTQKSGRTHQ